MKIPVHVHVPVVTTAYARTLCAVSGEVAKTSSPLSRLVIGRVERIKPKLACIIDNTPCNDVLYMSVMQGMQSSYFCLSYKDHSP